MKARRKFRRKKRKYGEAVFGLGLIPKEGVPEIKIRFNRTRKTFLGKVTSSKDADEILGYYRLAVGGTAGVVADPKLIFATAVISTSSAILAAHNHPSGNLSASQADIKLTNKIRDAGKLLDIALVDHIIITKKGYLSFRDENLI